MGFSRGARATRIKDKLAGKIRTYEVMTGEGDNSKTHLIKANHVSLTGDGDVEFYVKFEISERIFIAQFMDVKHVILIDDLTTELAPYHILDIHTWN